MESVARRFCGGSEILCKCVGRSEIDNSVRLGSPAGQRDLVRWSNRPSITARFPASQPPAVPPTKLRRTCLAAFLDPSGCRSSYLPPSYLPHWTSQKAEGSRSGGQRVRRAGSARLKRRSVAVKVARRDLGSGGAVVLVDEAAEEVTASDRAAVGSADRVGDWLGELQTTVWTSLSSPRQCPVGRF